jgi:O-antigen/teichoic acid export membrane protein
VNSLKDKTAKGLFWGGLSNGLQQLLGLAFGIVLARILDVDDYGMVGLLTLFSAMASILQDGGFITALATRKEEDPRAYTAVFWVSVSCSATLYLLLFACAPLIAAYFHTPELKPLARVVFLGFLISSFAIVPRAILFRHLKVRQTAISTLSAQIVSGIVGVALALAGFAYWGLAFQSLTYIATLTCLSWYFARWRPSAAFDIQPVREMFGFSSKVMLTNLCTAINNNFFVTLLAKVYTKTDAGFYTQANKWNTMGHSFVSGMVGSVAQPVLASVATDNARQLAVLRKMLRFTALCSFPAMLGLSLIAEDLIVITITDRWLPAAQMMQWLCVWGAFIPVNTLLANLLISRGKSNIYLYNTVSLIALQLLVVVAADGGGILRLIRWITLLNVCWFFVWRAFVGREVGLTLWRALKDVLPFCLMAVGALVVAAFCASFFDSPYARLPIAVGTGAAVYIGVLWLLDAKILKACIAYFVQFLRRKPAIV